MYTLTIGGFKAITQKQISAIKVVDLGKRWLLSFAAFPLQLISVTSKKTPLLFFIYFLNRYNISRKKYFCPKEPMFE